MKKILVIVGFLIIFLAFFLYTRGGQGVPSVRQYISRPTSIPTEIPIEEIRDEEISFPTATPLPNTSETQHQLPASGLP